MAHTEVVLWCQYVRGVTAACCPVWQLVLDSSRVCERSTCDTQLNGSKPFCRDRDTYRYETTYGAKHTDTQVVNAFAGMPKSTSLYLWKATSPSRWADRRPCFNVDERWCGN
jgi:hypothetical protein